MAVVPAEVTELIEYVGTADVDQIVCPSPNTAVTKEVVVEDIQLTAARRGR